MADETCSTNPIYSIHRVKVTSLACLAQRGLGEEGHVDLCRGSWFLNNSLTQGVKVWKSPARLAETSVDMENLIHHPWMWKQQVIGECCLHPWAGQGEGGTIVLGWHQWERGGERVE